MNTDRVPDLPSDLKSFEAQLAALVPASNLSRDELMYRAGWEACAAAAVVEQTDAARRPVGWRRRTDSVWWASTAALVMLSATLGVILATRAPEIRVVYERQPSAASGTKTNGNATTTPRKPIAESETPSPIQSDRRPRSDHDYLSLRDRVLALGPDVLPISAAEPVGRNEKPRDLRYGALRGALRGG